MTDIELVIKIPEEMYKNIDEPCNDEDLLRYIIKQGRLLKDTLTCEDAVSREAVIELAKKGTLISNGNFKSVCEAINNLPRVYPTLPTMVYPQVPGVTPCVVPDYKGGWRLVE